MMDDEKFFAWLDGELDPAEAARVEEDVRNDPQRMLLAEQHRGLRERLKRAFDPIAAEAVPEHLQAPLKPSAEIIDIAAARASRGKRALPAWTALAASLAVGLLLGTQIPRQNNDPLKIEDGRIYAAAGLEQGLETQLASVPDGKVRIGMTFRDRAGQICRTFTQISASGLACRSGNHWEIRGLFGVPEGQAGDYRMAAGMDPGLAALVDSSISGEPMNAEEEKAELQRKWK
jgi:hypothetical protein